MFNTETLMDDNLSYFWMTENHAMRVAAAEAEDHGGECVGCGRIMSKRERAEQDICDECAEGTANF